MQVHISFLAALHLGCSQEVFQSQVIIAVIYLLDMACMSKYAKLTPKYTPLHRNV